MHFKKQSPQALWTNHSNLNNLPHFHPANRFYTKCAHKQLVILFQYKNKNNVVNSLMNEALASHYLVEKVTIFGVKKNL